MNISEVSSGLDRHMIASISRETDISRVNSLIDPNLEVAEPKKNLDKLDHEKLAGAVNSIREYVNSMGVKLKFEIHQKSDQVQVTVVNPENEKIIRKIPPDEILDLAASIEEMLGLFINKIL